MAAQLTNQTGIYIGNGGAIQERLARVAQAWRLHRQYRATLAELRALPERDRADLGLDGQDLDEIARKAVYGI